ncbi:MAG: flagellum-specific ATP synthase FliI, partial [Hyphomonas sp.]|nr:flagellum-specific ATP synthase FliI [Hyphomonas sp.]
MSSSSLRLVKLWGTVTEVAPGMVKVAGVSELAGVGNEIVIEKQGVTVLGEILSVAGDTVTALLYSPCDTIRIGDPVQIEQEARVEPGDHWLGQIVNYRGELTGTNLPPAPAHTSSRRL